MGMCEYAKTCKYYNSTSNTCNKTSGNYYSANGPAGCWRDNYALSKSKRAKSNTMAWLFVILPLVLILTAMPYVNAVQTYQKQIVNIPTSITQTCSNSTYSNITKILTPSNLTTGSIVELNGQYGMTKSGDNYNYTYVFKQLGTYYVYGICDENGAYTNWQYDIPVESGQSLTILIILLSVAFIFLILSAVLDVEFFLFVSGVLFILSGMFLMIFGIDNTQSLYTYGISVILIGAGLLFTIGAYETYGSDSENKFEDDDFE